MQAFKQPVEQFPESKYSEDGRIRIDYITNSLAAYEVHVARATTTTAARISRRRTVGRPR